MIFLFARNAYGLFTFLTNLKINWNDDRYTHLRYQISYSSTPLSFLLIQANIETHSDKGRCSALNGSKVTESSFRQNGKSHNLKKKKCRRRVFGTERWERTLVKLFNQWLYGGGGKENNSDTLIEKWCELSFRLYSPGLLYFSEDSNSHQSFPSAPFDAARFKEKQEGLLRHSMVQSRVSYTAYVPTLGTFK